jgi:hypothetical protein
VRRCYVKAASTAEKLVRALRRRIARSEVTLSLSPLARNLSVIFSPFTLAKPTMTSTAPCQRHESAATVRNVRVGDSLKGNLILNVSRRRRADT